jgi:hypothetical protein
MFVAKERLEKLQQPQREFGALTPGLGSAVGILLFGLTLPQMRRYILFTDEAQST